MAFWAMFFFAISLTTLPAMWEPDEISHCTNTNTATSFNAK
jgi:hypothetical protein